MKSVVTKEDRQKISYSFTDICNSDVDYFYKVVRVFSAAFLDTDYYLTDRELELLYCCFVAIISDGRNLLDQNIIDKHFKSFKDKKTLQVWIPKLINKGWLRCNGEEYFINGNFEKLVKLKSTSFNLDFLKIDEAN